MSDAAITIIVAAVLQFAGMVFAYLSLKEKLRHGAEKAEEAAATAQAVEKKVDENTAITQAEGAAAKINAKAAAAAAVAAVKHTQEISKKLNGGVDSAIREAISPVSIALADHAAADERNMVETNGRLKEIETYLHQREHRLADSVGVLSNRVEALVILVERLQQQQQQQQQPPKT